MELYTTENRFSYILTDLLSKTTMSKIDTRQTSMSINLDLTADHLRIRKILNCSTECKIYEGAKI